MLPTPAPSPTIDPCNHPPAIVSKAPLRSYGAFPLTAIPIGRYGSSRMPPDPLSAQLPQREPLAVTLDVLIDAAGRPLVARVVTTSSDTSFDRASIDAAMRSTYSAGKTKCAFVTAHYTFDETLGAAL